ncbi:hypothetical protein NKG95_26575 [Mesorhizobium sp. M1423]
MTGDGRTDFGIFSAKLDKDLMFNDGNDGLALVGRPWPVLCEIADMTVKSNRADEAAVDQDVLAYDLGRGIRKKKFDDPREFVDGSVAACRNPGQPFLADGTVVYETGHHRVYAIPEMRMFARRHPVKFETAAQRSGDRELHVGLRRGVGRNGDD